MMESATDSSRQETVHGRASKGRHRGWVVSHHDAGLERRTIVFGKGEAEHVLDLLEEMTERKSCGQQCANATIYCRLSRRDLRLIKNKCGKKESSSEYIPK